MRHPVQNDWSFLTFTFAAGLACVPRARAQIAVGQNGQISVDIKHAAHTEYFADADPSDANRLLACSMVIDPSHSRLSSDSTPSW